MSSQSSTIDVSAQTILNSGSISGLATVSATVDNQTLQTILTVLDTISPTASANTTSGLYDTPQNVALSMSEPGTIYYTTNDNTPTFNSNRYTNPISIAKTTTLKFFAIDISGNQSPIYTETYTIDTKPPTANSTPIGGFYNATKSVNLSMDESGSIYYTLNGSDPTTASSKYLIPIIISSTTILKYLAVDLASNKSPIYSQTYTIDIVAPIVKSIDPLNGAVNVLPNKVIKITFSEPIKAGSLWIDLKNSAGTLVSTSKSISGNVLTITHCFVINYWKIHFNPTHRQFKRFSW